MLRLARPNPLFRHQIVTYAGVAFGLNIGYCPRKLFTSKEGVEMTLNRRYQDPLAEFDRSTAEEIQKYKWIESEKAGQDIGWERARQEWLQKHFPAWKQNRWHRAIAAALQSEACLN